ncbi:hypothetical protein [Niveispirillum sp. KHB5.9]|uniref:hypothetical protein n=1 Tax=Niveispirillum sp. KHB5.9 TaxID=3400269 RepID=UPI003A837564
MKDFEEEAGGLRKLLGNLVSGLNGALMLDEESRSILETHYLKAQSEILAGYQQVIDRRLKTLEGGRRPRKVTVE